MGKRPRKSPGNLKMADKGTEVVDEIANDPKTKSAVARLKGWGSSAVPPSVLATLVIGLHMRPRQPLALLLFPAPLFAATYFNLAGYPTAAGGLTAAWSGLYALTDEEAARPARPVQRQGRSQRL